MAQEQKTHGKISPGDRFGNLTVIRDSGRRKNGYIVWVCRCSCGNELEVDKRTLERGTVTDCGCISRVRPGQRDLTGQRFGILTAEYCTGKKAANGSYIWHLRCDCGNTVEDNVSQLNSGYRKSCGCLSHPLPKDLVGKKFGRLTVTGYAGKENGMHQWLCRCQCGNEVKIGQTRLQSGKTRSCGCLRTEMTQENMKLVAGTSVTLLEKRRGKLNANNTSGCTGVYLNKRSGSWCAQLEFQGKKYYLGSFRDKADAVKARLRGEEMYDNFLGWYYDEYLPSAGKNPEKAKKGAEEPRAAAG